MRKYSYLLSLFIVLALTIFFAENARAVYDPNSRNGQWLVDRITADPTLKGTTHITAQRNYPVSTLGADGKPILQNKIQKSTIKLVPKAANVGKSLIKRAPAIAITQAVVALLGKGVDWLLDPENNRVKYKDPDAVIPDLRYRYNIAGYTSSDPKYYAATPQAACLLLGVVVYPHWSSYKWTYDSSIGKYGGCKSSITDVSIDRSANPNYDSSAPVPDDYKYIPIDTVAQKIIDQANSATASTGSNTGADGGAALQVMSDAALDMLEAGLLDAQLEAAADAKIFNEGESDPMDSTNTGGGTGEGTDEGTGEGTDEGTGEGTDEGTDEGTGEGTDEGTGEEAKPFEFPPFCDWATKVCDFIDWVQTEPAEPEESGDIEVQKPDPVIHEDLLERLYINMPAQCPPDPVLEFMGARIPFPMSVFCQFAVMMKPLILLFAYIKGLAIIGNGLS